jgi:hypothetical protein
VVGREGFEPSKALSQQIYSLPRLTDSVPAHLCGDDKGFYLVWQGQKECVVRGAWFLITYHVLRTTH